MTFPSVPSPPPHAAELQVRQLVATLHRNASARPIGYADSTGAFPGSILVPGVFPLVLDANMIRGELIRIAVRGRTVLVNGANDGVFRLFVAQHVVDEVERHYPTWALRKKVDVAAVREAWERELLPLLRCVDVPEGWATLDESARLSRLAMAPPEGDPDDLPIATLALLLEAPLLSRDAKPIAAVYGSDFDRRAHTEWLNVLKAGGDLGPLGQYQLVSTNLIVLLGKAAVGGVRAIAARWSRSPALWVGLGSAALAAPFVPSDLRKRVGSSLGAALNGIATFLIGLHAAHQRAEEQFRTLAAPAASDDEVLADLEPSQAIARLCLRELTRSAESRLTAAELHDRLEASYTIPGGAQTVQHVLERWDCFVRVRDGEYQVGRALMVAQESDVAQADARR